ncbi:MAG TPA: hypothetical protein VGQ76_18375 [Thermoanaerobaculia bacterium]|jgi:hypothetical protein|nr:hypothetical protein [Thermoanaerobaculia bacterium]
MKPDDQEGWKSKLTSELGELASSAAAHERVSVLIELDLAPSRVRFDRDAIRHGGSIRPEFLEEAPQAQTEAVISSTAKQLQNLLSEPPRWIGAAKAFVGTVSPAKLREVASLPHVRQVRLNRQLR